MFGQSLNFGGIANAVAAFSVDYLAIGGGGSGSLSYKGSIYERYDGGGGGAGEVQESTATFYGGTTYTVTIGGAMTDTTIAGSDITTITSVAGGHGGYSYIGTYYPGNGASGGGAGVHSTAVNGGASTKSQGSGGNYTGTNWSPNESAGGGGYSTNGSNSSTNSSTGGNGTTVTFYDSTAATALGIPTAVAGGGGGAQSNGGSGGGGRGGRLGFYHASPGSANTGSGGGAAEGQGDYQNVNAGGGGSGMVVFKIPTADWAGSTTGSPTTTTSGTDTLIAFKGSGTITF
jgi:hypothetical protein